MAKNGKDLIVRRRWGPGWKGSWATGLLPYESKATAGRVRREMAREFQPATALEWVLVDEIAYAIWTLRRVREAEAGVLRLRGKEIGHYITGSEGDPSQELALAITRDASRDRPALTHLSRLRSEAERSLLRKLNLLEQAQRRRLPPSPAPLEI